MNARRYRDANHERILAGLRRKYEEDHGPAPECEMCHKPMARRKNKYGVCRRNPECNLEHSRRFQEVNRERRREQARIRYHEDAEKARDKVREYRARQSDHHDELTYLMYSPGQQAHKIGHTTSVKNNTRTLRRGCPDIELVITFPYGRKLETWLHDHFKATRIEGTEWFKHLSEVKVRAAVAEFETTLELPLAA